MPVSSLPSSSRPGSPIASISRLTDASQIKGENHDDQVPSAPSDGQSASMPLKRYLPLLPKPTPEPTTRSTVLSNKASCLRSHPPRRCQVKLCVLKDCNLRSHRQYGLSRRSGTTSTRKQSEGQPKIAKSSPNHDPILFTTSRSSVSIVRGGVDGLPVLPLNGLDNPMFRELFRNFFSYHYDRLIRLLHPPPRTRSERLAWDLNKRSALSAGLSTPVYCLNWIAAAHHTIVSRGVYQGPDQTTALIYGQIMKLLRAKLEYFDRNEAEDLVMVVGTLITLEIAMGHAKNLISHRKALHDLIEACGGVHHMIPRAVPIALTMDRILSIFTGLPPWYTPPPNHLVRRPHTVPILYGRFLNDSSSSLLLGEEVRQYCVDCCRAIEILEWEGLSFDPRDPPIRDSPNLYYLFFLRGCILDEFVRLNVKFSNDQTISRCVLLTTKIVEYYTMMDNYLSMLSLDIANRVRKILCSQNSTIKWEYQRPLLTWILYVLTSMAGMWEHRGWAVAYLRQQLELKYGGRAWPVNWRQNELDGVRGFVWSDTKFCNRFAKTCNDLEQLLVDD